MAEASASPSGPARLPRPTMRSSSFMAAGSLSKGRRSSRRACSRIARSSARESGFGSGGRREGTNRSGCTTASITVADLPSPPAEMRLRTPPWLAMPLDPPSILKSGRDRPHPRDARQLDATTGGLRGTLRRVPRARAPPQRPACQARRRGVLPRVPRARRARSHRGTSRVSRLPGASRRARQGARPRFDEAKGEHLFRSTLVQTLFYGLLGA